MSCSNEPDWGDHLSWQPSSSSANLDDEAVARQLQAQYNREVNGGGFTSLEAESLAVARQLQVQSPHRRADYRLIYGTCYVISRTIKAENSIGCNLIAYFVLAKGHQHGPC